METHIINFGSPVCLLFLIDKYCEQQYIYEVVW